MHNNLNSAFTNLTIKLDKLKISQSISASVMSSILESLTLNLTLDASAQLIISKNVQSTYIAIWINILNTYLLVIIAALKSAAHSQYNRSFTNNHA